MRTPTPTGAFPLCPAAGATGLMRAATRTQARHRTLVAAGAYQRWLAHVLTCLPIETGAPLLRPGGQKPGKDMTHHGHCCAESPVLACPARGRIDQRWRPERRILAHCRRSALVTNCDPIPGPVPRETPDRHCSGKFKENGRTRSRCPVTVQNRIRAVPGSSPVPSVEKCSLARGRAGRSGSGSAARSRSRRCCGSRGSAAAPSPASSEPEPWARPGAPAAEVRSARPAWRPWLAEHATGECS